MNSHQLFSAIPEAPNDPILGITEKFMLDARPEKINLGVGVYQDENGKALKLSSVRKAEQKILAEELLAGYGPLEGNKVFNAIAQEFLFGKGSSIISDGRAVTIQSPGGTAAVRLGAELLRNFFNDREVWLCNPTWDNHTTIFGATGASVRSYSHYNRETHALNYPAILEAMNSAKNGSIFVLHACCHNPTGYDFTREQWQEIHSIFKARSLIAFFDIAYQGFAEGIDEDAYPIRLFAEDGLPCLIASSFSKNFGLYSERCGAFTVVTSNRAEANNVGSQIKQTVRTLYTNPPARAAKIVCAIIQTPDLYEEWNIELAQMRTRMKRMRSTFIEKLAASNTGQDFSYIGKQSGMFSFSGLSKDVVMWLREHRAIYALDSGRICVAALNDHNVAYVCESIATGIKAVKQ